MPGLGSPISVPLTSVFCQTKVLTKLSPCERRLVTFTCSELYQVSPFGSQYVLIVVNCGNGPQSLRERLIEREARIGRAESARDHGRGTERLASAEPRPSGC